MRYLFILFTAVILVVGVKKFRETRGGESHVLRARVIELQNRIVLKERIARKLRDTASVGPVSTPIEAAAKVFATGTHGDSRSRMLQEAGNLEREAEFDRRTLRALKDQLFELEHNR